MNKITVNSIIKRNSELVTSSIDGEIVMMSIENGEYYGIDEIGSRIWELISTPVKVELLIEILLKEFDVEKEICTLDTLEFLNNLSDKNLVISE